MNFWLTWLNKGIEKGNAARARRVWTFQRYRETSSLNHHGNCFETALYVGAMKFEISFRRFCI